MSLALEELSAEGLLARRGDGSWLLHYEAFERLGGEAAVPRGWQPADAQALPAASAPDVRTGVRPLRPDPGSDDIGALRDPVEELGEQHAGRGSRCTATVERAAAARRAADVARARRRMA